MRPTARCLIVVAFLASASTARAQGAAASEADRLFAEGTALLDARKFAEACPKLAESRRIDPHALGTLVNLARCHEEDGKTATAYAEYTELETRATERNQPERIALAKRRKAGLEPKLARIVLKVTSPTPGERVTIDTQPTTESTWGSATPIDPGEHTIESTAPNVTAWSQKVTIPDGPSSTEVVVPALAAPKSAVVIGPTAPAPESGNGRRTLGYAIAGAGLVGVGVGTVFGVIALSGASDVNDACPTRTTCTPGTLRESQSDYDSAKTAATIATIAIPIGLVALGAGIVLALTAPKSATASLRFAPRGLAGSF